MSPLLVVSAMQGMIASAIVICALLVREKLRRTSRESGARAWDTTLIASAAAGTLSESLCLLFGAIVRPREFHLGLLRVWEQHVGAMDEREHSQLCSLLFVSRPYRRLLAELASHDPLRRCRSAVVLGRLRLPSTVKTLAPLLRDGNGDVRSAALKSLAFAGSDAAARAILDGLRDRVLPPERIVERLAMPWAALSIYEAWRRPEFRDLRGWLITALSLAGDAAAEDLAMELLADGDQEARVHACRALSRSHVSDRAVRALLEALDDSFAPVRGQAAKALAGVERPQVVTALAGALSDQAWWVRANAGHALGRSSAGMRVLRHSLISSDPFARDRAREEMSLAAAREGALGKPLAA